MHSSLIKRRCGDKYRTVYTGDLAQCGNFFRCIPACGPDRMRVRNRTWRDLETGGVSGGAVAYEQCKHSQFFSESGGSRLSVPGAKHAYALPNVANGPEVCATDGVTMVVARGEFADFLDAADLSKSSLHDLGAILASVFAATSVAN
jgi:hypothetical protein